MQSRTSVNYINIKKVIIFGLFLLSAAICLSGIIFGVYSWIYNLSFKVINTNVSGIIFGLVVAYLGLRYFMSVFKLKNELFKSTSVFSWSNFKKTKKSK